MSGQRRDIPATVLRGALRVASVGYGTVIQRRNVRFDQGHQPIGQVDVPVISVGNLTAGGTGKTPIVCYLADWLDTSGWRVALVSRGYGSGADGENDEAKELRDRLPLVPHVQNPDRVAAAKEAVREHAADVIVLDDGFQHRRLHRDCDIVIVDATCPFGYGYLLPRGLLREPLTGFQRADLVIITRCDQVSSEAISNIEATIAEQCADASIQPPPIFRSVHRIAGLRNHHGDVESATDLNGQRVAVVCAIGNPNAFLATVRQCGATIVDHRFFPDHDPYDGKTIRALESWITSFGAEVDRIVCTHKDLVKIRREQIAGKPVSAIQIQLGVENESELHEAILSKLGRPHVT